MDSPFPGFPKEGLAFLRELKKNNSREWFQPRKEQYETLVRAPMIALIEALNRDMRGFAPEHVDEPKKVIYRLYRDTRFSNDKTPYKTHIAAVFPRRGQDRHSGAGFYFAVSPEHLDIGGGVYMPQPAALYAIRERIAANPAAFRKLIAAAPVKKLLGTLDGEQLKRVPKGFDPDHPAADLLRYKQFLLFTRLDGSIAATPGVFREVRDRLKAITPFCNFLNGVN
jgi:uncharacterized protein (TIGR02453 family)